MRNPERGCSEYVELIIQHLDGLLPAARAAELEAHVAGCAVCRAELLLQQRIRDALTEEIHPRLSIDFTRLVTERVVETEKPVRHAARRRPVRLGLIPAFGLLAIAVLLFVLPNSFRAALGHALQPTGDALSSAAGSVAHVFSGMLPRAGGMPSLHISALDSVAGPVMLTLLLLVCILPVIWCFRSIGEFLKG